MTIAKQSEISAIQQEIKDLTVPLIPKIKVLKITDADTYAQADSYLSRIAAARRTVESRINKILDPLNEARNETLNFKRELDNPLAQIESDLRDGMKKFKLEEATQKRLIEEERAAVLRRIEAEADKKRIQAENAKTSAMRTRLLNQQREIESRTEDVLAKPIATPVRVANSTTRNVKKPVVVDKLTLIRAVASGDIPDDIIQIDRSVLNMYFKMDESMVNKWPGIEIKEDILIISHRRS